jgi:hypothetical protein
MDFVGAGHYFTEEEYVESSGLWFVPYGRGKGSGDNYGVKVPLASVPPAVFSEAVRDADLVCTVALEEPSSEPDAPLAVSPEVLGTRAALVTWVSRHSELGRHVRVEGRHALVEGRRARYKIHLATGAAYIEPGTHLITPPEALLAREGIEPLPFPVEDDPVVAEVVSKALLFAGDDKITDAKLVAQIEAAVGKAPKGAPPRR